MPTHRRRKVVPPKPAGMRASTKTMIVGLLTVTAGIVGTYWKTHRSQEPASVPPPQTTIAPVFNNIINPHYGEKPKPAAPDNGTIQTIDPARPPPPPVEAMEAKSSHTYSRPPRRHTNAIVNIGSSGAQTSIGY